MSARRGLIGKLEDLKNPLTRQDLLDAAGQVLDVGLERMGGRYTKNPERVAWARVVVAAVSAASLVLRDVDLDQLSERVKRLEGR